MTIQFDVHVTIQTQYCMWSVKETQTGRLENDERIIFMLFAIASKTALVVGTSVRL